MIDKLIVGVLSPIFSVIDKAVPDKDKANELKAEIEMAVLANKSELIQVFGDIARMETTGKWYQRSWRPALAFTYIALIWWGYFIAPLAGIDPPDPEAFVQVGGVFLTVYGAGRTVEKRPEIVTSMFPLKKPRR